MPVVLCPCGPSAAAVREIQAEGLDQAGLEGGRGQDYWDLWDSSSWSAGVSDGILIPG